MYRHRYQPAGIYAEHGLLDKHFRKIKFLGQGSFGKVYQVERKSDGQVYALKELDVRSMKQAERKDAVNEARFLASVQHINVLSYKEAFIDGNKLCIVMEYAPYGDLHQLLRQRQAKSSPLSETQIWSFFIQTLQGVAALHELGVLHRDIKPLNIMVTDTAVVKLGDLGIARRLVGAAGENMARTQIGTPHYMAPEIWRGQSYGLSTDMWSLGCLLFQLATLKVPFDARDINMIKSKIMRNEHSPIPSSCPADVSRIIRLLLAQSPSARPTAQQLLSHPIIQKHMSCLPSSVRDAPTHCGKLLATINVPVNLSLLQDRLPPANYEGDNEAALGRQKPRLSNVAEGDTGDAPSKKIKLPNAKPQKLTKQGNDVARKARDASPASAFDKKVRQAMEKQKEAGAEAKVVVGSKAHRVPARDIQPRQQQQQQYQQQQQQQQQLHNQPHVQKRAPSTPRLVGNRLIPSPRKPSPNVALRASPSRQAAPPAPYDLHQLSPALARLRQRIESQNNGSPRRGTPKTPKKISQGKGSVEAAKKVAGDKVARKVGNDAKQLHNIYGGVGVERQVGKKKVEKVDELSPAAIYMRYKNQVQQQNWQYNVRPSWM